MSPSVGFPSFGLRAPGLAEGNEEPDRGHSVGWSKPDVAVRAYRVEGAKDNTNGRELRHAAASGQRGAGGFYL